MSIIITNKDNCIIKGDTINLECTLDKDITNWKIRCQIDDEAGQCIKLATANSGGADDQIKITDASNGVFLIQVAKGQTTDFCDKGGIEIEVENTNTPTEKFTVLKGQLEFESEKITWETP